MYALWLAHKSANTGPLMWYSFVLHTDPSTHANRANRRGVDDDDVLMSLVHCANEGD